MAKQEVHPNNHSILITDNHRALLEAVTSTTDVQLAYLDPEFNFIWVNLPYAQTCHKHPSDLVGRNHFDLYPNPENEAIFRRVRDSGQATFYKDKPFEFPDQPERGVTYWDWSLAPVKGKDGAVQGLVFSLRETTEFKRIELLRTEYQSQLFKFIEQAPISMAMFDRSMNYLAYSKRWLESNGRGYADLRGRNHYEVHPDLPEEWKMVHRRAMTGETINNDEDYWRRADGSEQWLRWAVVPWRDEQDQVGGIIISSEDITERKQAEAALLAALRNTEQANQTKTRFLAAASHDLRQPMMAISLYLDILSKSSLTEAQSGIVSRIQHSRETLSVMLNALLDVAKLDSGTVVATFSAIRVSELFNWIEDAFSEQFRERGLRLDYFCARDEPVLHTDIALLQSILINLLDNALKYCEKGKVLVSLRRRGERALLQVWDNGIGIAPKDLDHVFDEYFQVSNPERNLDKGLGLGLSIVTRKVKLIGGEVECRSELGKGTVFSLWLPLAPQVTEAPNGQSDRGQITIGPEHFAGKRFVLIEDNAAVREALQVSFRAYGLELAAFDSAESLLADPKLTQADFFISDFRLPGGMNGMQLLDEIERRQQTPIKGVLLTGETLIHQPPSPGSRNWKLLVKPCYLPELLAALAELE